MLKKKLFFLSLGLLVPVLILSIGVFANADLHGREDVEPQPEPVSEVREGYVDLELALGEFGPYQEAQRQLSEYQQELQGRIDEMEEQLEELQQSLQFRSPEGQREIQEQMQRLFQEYQSLIHESEARLDQREEELLEPVHQEVQVAVSNLGEAFDLDVIKQFDGVGTDVLWVAPRVDFTEELIDELQVLEDS